jgi:hypothetical protein
MVKDWKNIQQQETVQKWSSCRELSCNLSGNREQSWADVLVVTSPRLETSAVNPLFLSHTQLDTWLSGAVRGRGWTNCMGKKEMLVKV